MTNYVGIDLGTSNSAICSFDGQSLQLYKAPDNNDVTPSAIFVTARGQKYVGRRAYDNAAKSPENAATLFKRLMGTNTPIRLPAASLTMSPEECSAEVLRVLFAYLPEEIRSDDATGTVITVPAAFNQMQKDATMNAAEMAGLGKVALMQEPVAAVMSIMRQRKGDGVFLVFDLGGGTLDIAVAESIAGRVNLLHHGGIAMCGGRDFDRVLMDSVVTPWVAERFQVGDGFARGKELRALAMWATEKAKVELSSREETTIALAENEIGLRDNVGKEIYLDIPISRARLDELIAPKVAEAVAAARETLEKAGLGPHDVERMVFVGGPTQYKPLREKVSFELGVSASTEVNPMLAVAEGAAVFAESIDWASQSRQRKSSKGTLTASDAKSIRFSFIARTPDSRGKVAVNLPTQAPGGEFQIDSTDTGWSSGRLPLKHGTVADVPLSKAGDNVFKVYVFDTNGSVIGIEDDRIIIARTAATVDAIPASSSIGIEVAERVGGRRVLDYLVKEGEALPKKGKAHYKAEEAIAAGSAAAINFKLWEGDIEHPITDNRFVGTMSITGADFSDGVIPVGADLFCNYEILDAGNIVIEVSAPCIGGTFHSGHNFYSSKQGQVDYTDASQRVVEEAEVVRTHLQAVAEKVDSPKIDEALQKVERAAAIRPDERDPEACKQAMDQLLEVKKVLAQLRKEHLKEIRQIDLDQAAEFFERVIKEMARPTEVASSTNLVRTAQRAIDNNLTEFETYLDQLKQKSFEILWRQDWFVVERFKRLVEDGGHFPDKSRYAQLIAQGREALEGDAFDKLRQVVGSLQSMRVGSASDDEMVATANILRA